MSRLIFYSLSWLSLGVLQSPETESAFIKWTTRTAIVAVWILSETTQVSRYQKKHSPTHTCYGHQSSLICFLHLLQSMASFLFSLHAWQSFSTISLQIFLAWHPPLNTPYISSTSYCLIFAAHARTIATCFAVLPRCHLIGPNLSFNPLLVTVL